MTCEFLPNLFLARSQSLKLAKYIVGNFLKFVKIEVLDNDQKSFLVVVFKSLPRLNSVGSNESSKCDKETKCFTMELNTLFKFTFAIFYFSEF